MTTGAQLDMTKVEAFAEKALVDSAGATAAQLAWIGGKIGLFRALASIGPSTSTELADATQLNERYAREWLRGMLACGYLTYDAGSERFTLPVEHVPVLAEEAGTSFMLPLFDDIFSLKDDAIAALFAAFRNGGGVSQSVLGDETQEIIDRFTAPWFEHMLVQEWLPAMPDVDAMLDRGIAVADVGCGRGRALVKLAQSYPNSRFVGFDIYAPSVESAREAARAAGVSDRVTFEVRDVSKGLPDTYELITTFDVVHDSVDPRGLLKALRAGLKPAGRYVCVDINCSDKVEENIGPVAAILYGASIRYCMTVSLADGGEGLGTLGLPESKLRELATEAGFSSVRRVPIENPFNNVYEVMA